MLSGWKYRCNPSNHLFLGSLQTFLCLPKAVQRSSYGSVPLKLYVLLFGWNLIFCWFWCNSDPMLSFLCLSAVSYITAVCLTSTSLYVGCCNCPDIRVSTTIVLIIWRFAALRFLLRTSSRSDRHYEVHLQNTLSMSDLGSCPNIWEGHTIFVVFPSLRHRLFREVK